MAEQKPRRDLVLEVRDAIKSYALPDGERLPVLDVPRFDVLAGEQVVLVGRSGCGKTTLLHAIAGITTLDAGAIRVDGVPIQALPESGRDRLRANKIGYVFQTFNLLSGFSALENVLLGMTFGRGGVDAERARWLLTRVGLGHRLNHPPPRLSVGEQQRVAVARALANRPRLLLADEPTANVDRGNQQAIIDLLRETCREWNVAMVLVTHTQEVADQFERVERLEQLNRVVAEDAAG